MDDTITTYGIVTGVDFTYPKGYYLQDASVDTFAGIFAFTAGNNPIVSRGDSVEVTGFSLGVSIGVMLATAKFGSGRVAGTGDSSPIDDGTGKPGNNLYNGWGAGSDSTIILNTTYWLCKAKSSGVEEHNENYSKEEINVDSRDNTIIFKFTGSDSKINKITIYDCMSRIIAQKSGSVSIEISDELKGIYILKVICRDKIQSYKLNLFGGGKWLLSK